MTLCKLKNIEKNLGSFNLYIPNFSFKKGEIYSIIGPNGSGKSTFLDIVSLVAIPDTGEYYFNNKLINYKNNSLITTRRKISYLHQHPYIFNSTVFDNIAMGLNFRNYPKNKLNETVNYLMEKLNLTKYKNKYANSLSGGEKQRVAIARTLAIDAEVYLFDEITSNIDIENISVIENTIIDLIKEKNAAVLLTTHSKRQAYRLSTNVVSIINGKVSNTVYENIFTGFIKESKNKLMEIEIAKNVNVKLISDEIGLNTISIPPKDIILSVDKLNSSAINFFKGKIIKIENQHNVLRLSIDIGVKLNTVITNESFNKLKLNINQDVWVSFKANSVKILN